MVLVTDGYKPTLEFAAIAMRMFAQAGASDIAQRQIQPKAGSLAEALANAIADKTSGKAVNYEFNEKRLKNGNVGFWPLPEISGNEEIFTFFRPRVDEADGFTSLTVHLLLTDSSGNASLGIRFEQGLQNDSDRHHYVHAQLLPDVDIPSLGTIALCASIFSSCPAIPLPAIGPFGTWFAALVSIAGHERGGGNGITRAFDDARIFFSGQDFETVETALSAVIGRMLLDE